MKTTSQLTKFSGMLPGDTTKYLLPPLTSLRLSVFRLSFVICPVPCISLYLIKVLLLFLENCNTLFCTYCTILSICFCAFCVWFFLTESLTLLYNYRRQLTVFRTRFFLYFRLKRLNIPGNFPAEKQHTDQVWNCHQCVGNI